MPLTLSQRSAAFRQRRAEKMARMEEALQRIVDMSDLSIGSEGEWDAGYDAGFESAAAIARQALNPGKEARA